MKNDLRTALFLKMFRENGSVQSMASHIAAVARKANDVADVVEKTWEECDKKNKEAVPLDPTTEDGEK